MKNKIIKIAEYLGWIDIRIDLVGKPPGKTSYYDIPNYFKNNDAILEAEKTITNERDQEKYIKLLNEEITRANEYCTWFMIATAPANIRAEAFYRLITK